MSKKPQAQINHIEADHNVPHSRRGGEVKADWSAPLEGADKDVALRNLTETRDDALADQKEQARKEAAEKGIDINYPQQEN